MFYVQIQKFVYILFSFIVLGNSVSHLIEMSMLISLVGMLIQTRIGIGSVTFPRMGPISGKVAKMPANMHIFHATGIYRHLWHLWQIWWQIWHIW